MKSSTPANAVVRLLALAILLAPAAPIRSAEVVDGLAATVNGEVITVSEVRQAIAARAQVERMGNNRYTKEQFEALIAKLEAEALQDLIDRQLIIASFNDRGGVIKDNYIDDSIDSFILERFDGDRKKFIDELRDTGMTLSSFRQMREEALIVQYMRGGVTQDVPPPTPSERIAWYKKNLDQFRGKDFVDLRTITVPRIGSIPGSTRESQRKLVEEIRAKIADGADFSVMAKTYSEDSKASKGGVWGTIERDDFKSLLSDAAFSLKPNTVSAVLEDEKNYYLLWVDAAKRGHVTPLEEVRDEVDRFVMQEKRMAEHDKWLERLRADANITIFDRFTATP